MVGGAKWGLEVAAVKLIKWRREVERKDCTNDDKPGVVARKGVAP